MGVQFKAVIPGMEEYNMWVVFEKVRRKGFPVVELMMMLVLGLEKSEDQEVMDELVAPLQFSEVKNSVFVFSKKLGVEKGAFSSYPVVRLHGVLESLVKSMIVSHVEVADMSITAH